MSDAPPDADAASPAAIGSTDAIAAECVLPEIKHAIGPLRQAVLDHLVDSADAGPQSVAQILAALPANTTRNSVEAAIRREYNAGRIIRTSPGHYVLAPPQPPPAPPWPAPADDPAVQVITMVAGFAWQAADPGALTEDEWFAALEAWHADPSTWQLGPPPGQDSSQVPFDIWRRFLGRVRKRRERQAEADARTARQAAADAALVAELIEAAGGCVVRGPALDEVAPIRAALADGIPMDVITTGIRSKCDRRIYPPNEPAASWREERILRAIAELFCRRLVRDMVSAWGAAGNAPGKPIYASDAPGAVQEPSRPKDSPAAFPCALADIPAAPGRDLDARASIIAAFSRNRAPRPAPPPRPS